ncbi:MAG: histidine phosphatase family protein [Gammaproteobacteria bacterium]|nr:histidine phosphatase family protein [Gammaproteobacteria bacterium]
MHLCNDDPQRNVHLTPAGETQARAAAERLRNAGIERILVSELPRTRQTADIINRHHHAPIETHPLINDIRSGFDGQPVADYFAAIAHEETLRVFIAHFTHLSDEQMLDLKIANCEYVEFEI